MIRYRWQPGDGVLTEAYSGVTLLVRQLQAAYPDEKRKGWIERQVKAWAGQNGRAWDTARPPGDESEGP